ncbi:MAG: hypothetical protein ACYC21_06600 [Eubacteriales bacterium]
MTEADGQATGSRSLRDSKKQCANCFACKQDTELCPLNENYSPDAYLKWEAEYLKRRKENKAGQS